ncbi:HesA/MoeB/ThiF family protein [Parvularcula flava]|uniref:Molybdopterin-synthase adenylyltransferase n=1 Tax=Aquisalinus luteolus TaxID=1566827 RepID=A0A8J3ER83_9PROT|nr:HesA/MoeB/ThiF family protein [Aquisalinus luteolus]NHK28363.1 HesA/MoeB/ThiF family protein [Aquisalinus luteolus]GGH98250.1 thiamine biosynthesis protein ThiF [Aquisalinus luteolus]
MPLTPDQLERYKRHILLPEIGGQGQQALLDARVLVVGAGGLGCPILAYLAAAGVGHIRLCDDDGVALSNLQRQILFTTDDIGKPKATMAAERLQAINPDCTVEAIEARLTTNNAKELLDGIDLVIEGVDNFDARYALNDACLETGTPFLSAAIGRFDGQVALFTPGPDQPCYRCLVPETPPDAADCETQGVLGAVPGIVGAVAAMEAIRFLTGFGEPLAGHVLIYNGMNATTRRVKLPRDPACPACSAKG